MPNRKSLSDIKATILRPAMTSQYRVYIDFPNDVKFYMKAKGLADPQGGVLRGGLDFACSEASLPGSRLATLEQTSDRTGVTERHVHRRMFDESIDLTFYVDAQNYLPIRAFEYWKEYITIGNSETLASAAAESTTEFAKTNYFYRMNYPDFYALDQGFKVVKFERDFDGSFKGNNGVKNGTQNGLTYNFVRSYPIAVASMPVSYDASSLLKCTVSMTYIRYYITNGIGDYKNNTQTTADDPANTNNKTTPPQSQEAQNLKNEIGNARYDLVMNRISADEFRQIRSTNEARLAALQNP